VTPGTDGDYEFWTYVSGRRRFDPGIDQRVPFISDPWAEFEGTRSDGDSVLQTWVQMPAPQMTLGFQMVPQMHSLTSHVASFAS
jgi:hypothetical protein